MKTRHIILIIAIISSYILLIMGVIQHINDYIIIGFILLMCSGVVSILYRDSIHINPI